MTEELKAQVTKVLDAPVLLPTGVIERKIRVDYMVGVHGPFSITVPAEQFTAAAVKQEMDKTVAQLRALTL
jgi:hypothetical protein